MKRLFTPEGETALRQALRQRPLLAFDFDGTLAPIVARPADARVPAAVAERLQRLAARLPVAVISGRQVDDLRRRLPFHPWRLVGSHGAEDDAQPTASADNAQALIPARQRLAMHAQALTAAGVTVEDKGMSIALHYRLAADRDAAGRAIAHCIAGLPETLCVSGGKMVVNIVAARAHDKAESLAALVQAAGARGAVFVGDDLNDEPVFARPEPSWFTVRIGRDDPRSRAGWFLDGPADLPALLDRMLDALPAGAAAR